MHNFDAHPSTKLRDAREFMSEHFGDPLTVAYVAQWTGYSEFHFMRLFEERFKQSPHEFLTEVRVEKAKHLIRKSQLSVSEICLEVGYESLSSFSHLFLRETGYRPSEFRKVFANDCAYALKVVPCCFMSFRMGPQALELGAV